MFDFLTQKCSAIFSRLTGARTLSEKNLDEVIQKLTEAFLDADVPYDFVQQFVDDLKKEAFGKKIFASLKPEEQFLTIVRKKLVEVLGGEGQKPVVFSYPSVIMMMGLQGSGKTTTVGKVAIFAKKQATKEKRNCRILVASVDFMRPAAIDQLELIAQQAEIIFYRTKHKDTLSAAREAHHYFVHNRFDLFILDTAGRLHIDEQLVHELAEINAIIKAHHRLFILDAMTGQESIKVAQSFHEKVGITGLILTKMDSNARGGAALGFRVMIQKPILMLGTGEKLDNYELFYPERIANQIIGMGDMTTLLERAEEKIKQSEQKSIESSFASGKFSLKDFADQVDMIGRIGSLSQLIKYVPGLSTASISRQDIEKGEVEMRKFKAIINSMNPKERNIPSVLNNSRKQRIAKGAGVLVADINQLLERFEHAQQYVKLFKKMGNFKNIFKR